MLIVLRCRIVDENVCNKRRPNVIILLLLRSCCYTARGSPYAVLGDTIPADYRLTVIAIFTTYSQVPCDAATAVHAPLKYMTIILPIILRIDQKVQSSHYKLV